MKTDEQWMLLAIEEAKKAKPRGDWPFGAVVIKDGNIIGRGHARDKSDGDVTDHAELIAVRDACRNVQSNDLGGCAIYCTNEPCTMCAAGIFQANIDHVYIGASRDDLSRLLRPRTLRIEHVAEDAGYTIHIVKGILKDEVLELFKDIHKG